MSDQIKVAGEGKLKVGNKYECRHSRKGTFDVLVKKISGEWIDVEILKGEARNIARFTPNDQAGDTITVRDVHSYFIPINDD